MRFFAFANSFPGAFCKLKGFVSARWLAGLETVPGKSNPEAKERKGIAVVAAVVVGALLLAPDVKWALGDQSNWEWDQAYYAAEAINLFRAADDKVAAWAQAMAHATPGRPPLMIWVGQLAVPLRHVFGDVGFALLLLNLLWDGAVFWLVYVISRRLGASPLDALTALMACGASSIVIALNHQYFVETPQCAAAAFMMFAALQIEKRSWLRALSIIVLATVMSMLSKASSVTFVVPLLCYAFLAMLVTRSRPKPAMNPMDLLLAAGASGAALACFAWYRENLSYVTQHFHEATSDPIWGSEVRLWPKLSYWTSTLAKALTPFVTVPIVAAIITVGAIVVLAARLRWTKTQPLIESLVDSGFLFVLTTFGTVCATLLAFSLQTNEDTRFLISLIPMIAVLLGWALSVLQIRALSMAMLVALTAGGVRNHEISLGYSPRGLTTFNYLRPAVNDPSNRQLLTAAVQATCHDGNDGRWNVLGVDYTWLNGHAATFASAKEALLQGSRHCIYTNLDWREKDTARAIDTIFSFKTQYIITASAEKQPQIEAAGESKWANEISLPLAQALSRDPRFVRSPESNDTILIYQPAAEASASK